MRSLLWRFFLWSGAALLTVASSPAAEHPLMRDFIGICGHTVQFNPKLYSPIGHLVRDYHPVEWDLGGKAEKLPPFPLTANGVDWEFVYGSWKTAGWETDACLMFETIQENILKGKTSLLGDYAASLAKEFGPSSRRKLIQSVEIGNEPGQLSDACYREIFTTTAQAIRKADPALRIATCATTTGPSHRYAKSLDLFKDKTKLLDIITLHTYAQLENWPTWKRTFPEDPRLNHYIPDVENTIHWRDQYAPNKEIWITEYGYDSTTKQPDPKSDFAKWVGVTDTQQAQWIVRSCLLFSSLPIQRAYLYFFNDEDQPMLHGSSGITRHFQPKPSFYALVHLQKTLGNYRFSKILRQDSNGIWLFEYRDDSGHCAWVAWLASGSDAHREVTLGGIPGELLSCEEMPLSANPPSITKPEPQDATIRLTVGESPTYLIFKTNEKKKQPESLSENRENCRREGF